MKQLLKKIKQHYLYSKYIHRYFLSFEFILIKIISFLPSHTLRIIMLKFLGVKISNSIIYSGFIINNPKGISIDTGSVIGHKATLDGRMGIKIGKNVNLSSEVMLWTLQHDYNDPNFLAIGGPIVIEDYVWVSARAIILPNCKIGKGAVVAAGAVVTKDVLPFTVVGGIPAKKIAERNTNLNYSPADLGILPFI